MSESKKSKKDFPKTTLIASGVAFFIGGPLLAVVVGTGSYFLLEKKK